MSTLVLKVDFECSKCYNKIRRVLCTYHYEISSQTIDRKANTITISGPFDPNDLSKKIARKAGKALKGVEAKKPEGKKVEEKKPDEKPKPKDSDAKADKPKDKPAAADKPKDKPAEKATAAATATDKPKDKPAAEADKPKDKAADKPAQEAAKGDKPDKPKEAGAAKPDNKAPAPAPEAKTVHFAPEVGPAKAVYWGEPGLETRFWGEQSWGHNGWGEPGPVLAYPMVQEQYGSYSAPGYDYGRPVPVQNYGGNYAYAGNYGPQRANPQGFDYFTESNPSCTIM